MMRPHGKGSYLMDVTFEGGDQQRSQWTVGQKRMCVHMIGGHKLESKMRTDG